MDPAAALQLLVAVTTAGLTAIGWRYRSRPGGRPFVALSGAITALSAVYLVLLVDPAAPRAVRAAVSARESVLTLIPVLWFVFALDYTGYGRFVTRRTVAGLSAVPVATLAVLWIPPLRPLYWGPRADTITRGLVELGPPFGAWYWANLGYGYLLMTGGLLALFGLIASRNRLYTDQSVALVVGAVVPLVANVFVQLDVDPIPLPLQPLSFAVTALAFAFALYRFELFSVLPVTRRIGRNAVVEEMQEGVLIVDDSGRIVDANRAGIATFDRSRSALLGRPVRSVFDEQAPPEGLAPAEFRGDDGRSYEVTVSRIHDRATRPVGHAVVLRDVTDRELRETQLEVLNRVLRHNLRNELTVVRGSAEMLSQQGSGDHAEYAERQLAATDDLMALAERAREFEALDARREATPRSVEVGAILDGIVDDVVAEHPAADVTTAVQSGLTVETHPDVLTIVLENLLRNAVEHTGRSPTVEVTVTATGDEVEFEVRDDGPGIPDGELAVLEAGTETTLEHGSGLGLWITTWSVDHLGGSLAFETGERGTTATVTLPRTAPVSAGRSSGPPRPPPG